jgi:hypothetical protein
MVGATGSISSSSVHPDSEINDWDPENYRLAQEASGLFLGAMPPEEFLDKFLPVSQDAPKCPNSRGTFANVVSAENEFDRYAAFVSMVFFTVSAVAHNIW